MSTESSAQDVAQWEFLFHEMRRYKEEYGNLEVPFKWKDPMADFNNHFAKWFHAQPTLFLQRRLRPDQVPPSLPSRLLSGTPQASSTAAYRCGS